MRAAFGKNTALAAKERYLSSRLVKTLPLVVPILFYHGAVSPWPYSLSWL
ncbi:hypothetical protein SB6408_03892 [Klebsiella spallanzanii]|uniref:Transposase (putative) YhgA-like domain-containing protein n=1 Tax=Klebsiella spallanzanii TaxID=2587528 RepID=A0A564IL71_9ENTR|nr:hypothetical protein SB6408_03892 [Klebsiella spallanzanii]